jgi:K+-sensing histidine kinase KdpD
LLSNAIKFSYEKGSIILIAKLIKNEKDEDFIQILVNDHGQGMNTEEKKKLFKLFNSDNTKGNNTKGIGLGLCISKMIVE